ncbi:MAG: hypothetical protein ACFFFG_15000 [Candidatus Thorarchaeota archaeon]
MLDIIKIKVGNFRNDTNLDLLEGRDLLVTDVLLKMINYMNDVSHLRHEDNIPLEEEGWSI